MRLGAAAALVAVLVTFVAAVWWWGRRSRVDAAQGLSGPTTVWTVNPDDVRPPRPGAMARLVDYLDEHSVPVLVVAQADTRPGVVALGPSERVTWLAAPVRPGSVLLVQGSYSAERWARRGTLAGFVPRGVQVAGLTAGPPDQHYLQFVVGSVAALPAAQYVIGSKDPQTLHDVAGLLARAGAPTSTPIEMPAVSAWRDPTVVGVVLMLLAALACVALDWSMLAARLMPRVQLVRRHGASGSAVVRRGLGAAAPALLVGSMVGAATTLAVPMSEPSMTLVEAVAAWAAVTVVAGTLVALVWCAVVVSVSRIAVRRAG
ncbi:MAG: hypothetical protein ACTHN8_03520 [Angustibacter sp.]